MSEENYKDFVSPVITRFNYGNGITKRELFAAMAMQNLVKTDRGNYNKEQIDRGTHLIHARWNAQTAVDHADALIEELNRRPNEN